MAERSAFLYEISSEGLDIDSLCRVPFKAGLSITHRNGLVLVLDEDGNDILFSIEEFKEMVASRKSMDCLFWFPSGDSLYCRCRTKDGIRVTEYGMKGTEEGERNILRDKLIDDFTEKHSSNTSQIGLIFDPEGVSEDYDWDEFFVQGKDLVKDDFPYGLPEVVLLKRFLEKRVIGFLLSHMGRETVSIVAIRSQDGAPG